MAEEEGVPLKKAAAVKSAGSEQAAKEIEDASIEEVFSRLGVSEKGLSTAQVEERLAKYGHNALEEKHTPAWIQYLLFFWNPMSWCMEIAAFIAIVLADWIDSLLVAILLFINATIGFWEEHTSGEAIAALKANLAPNSRALRNGTWDTCPAKDLVPGDIIKMRLGDIIPADAKLLQFDGVCKVDQASLTGESLPVTKYPGNTVFSGAVLKQGEVEAVVYATGSNTFFGKAAALVQATVVRGHFQTVLTNIGYFCICFIVVFVIVELVVEFGIRKRKCNGTGWNEASGACYPLVNTLVLIVGGIPIAMPTVMSVTMAVGAGQLAKEQAIVARLTAVEEMAGMNVLCSDKTGTLTLNKLTVKDPELTSDATARDVVFHAALAAGRVDPDAIDGAILGFCEDKDKFDEYDLLQMIPFDPVSKRVTAIYKHKQTGEKISVCKGAPQIVLGMAHNVEEIHDRVDALITDYAGRGYRTLGVGIARDPEGQVWELEGLIPLFDPPRHDTAETIEKAQHLGLSVKMITGDQAAIAKETCNQLKMGNQIEKPDGLVGYDEGDAAEKERIAKHVENADGFAGVYPEHKYKIVEILQHRGYFVGMTGDGVNDAPALKKADIGIAVADATDAARAAADIVLMSPGLGVIITAIIGARRIFQRMRNYAMYAVSTTVRNCLTFTIYTVAWEFYFPTYMIAIVAILNDGTILTVSTDRVTPSPFPDHWFLGRIYALAWCLGGYLVITSIFLMLFAWQWNAGHTWFGLKTLTPNELRAVIYLNICISGQAIIFSTRSVRFFFSNRPSYALMIAFVIAQTASTFIAVYGFGGYPNQAFNPPSQCPGPNNGPDQPRTQCQLSLTNFEGCGWGWALFVWIWSLLLFLPLDPIKLLVAGFFAAQDKKKVADGIITPNVPLEKPQGHPVYGRMESFQPGFTAGSVMGRTMMGVPDTLTVMSAAREDLQKTVTSLADITFDGARPAKGVPPGGLATISSTARPTAASIFNDPATTEASALPPPAPPPPASEVVPASTTETTPLKAAAV